MGSDLSIANSARVSFHKNSEFNEDGSLKKSDEKLIKFLADNNHWTPFSHTAITVRVKAPIFVARQAFKSKVGFTENEVSRRYVSDEPEFYSPAGWRLKAENKKQGSSENLIEYLDLGHDEIRNLDELVQGHYTNSKFLYNKMIENGVCPEQARMVLPQAMYTEWYWTGSLSAFARVYGLRIKPDAQKEVQLLAQQIGEIIEPLFPVAWPVLTSK
jgi:thymidylate synthase (FAD)